MADAAVATEIAPLLQDPDPLVRANAVAIQQVAPQADLAVRLLPLLEDERRVVRNAAVRELLTARIARLPGTYEDSFRAATAEWQETLSANADFPETQLVLGGVALTMRNVPAALASFREAVHLDPQLVSAWSMVVRLEAASGNADAAQAALKEALARNPGDPTLLQLAEAVQGQ